MTRCRWTDRIADAVADPAGGVGALTAEEHAHIGRCAECFSTVERLVHLDRALTGDLRSLERGELPRSVLATPAYERRSRPPVLPVVLGGLAVAAAVLVVVVGSGLARNGLSWIGTGTATPMPSISPVPSAEPSVSPSLEPTPGAVPAGAALEIGAIAAVVDEPLVVRTSPGATDASTITDDRLWLGQRVRLLEGPVEADGYPWWRVRVGEIEGWISAEEKDGSAPWISPIANGRVAFATQGGTDGATSNPDGSDLQPLFPEQLLSGIDLVTQCGPRLAVDWSGDGSFLIAERVTTCGATIYRVSADRTEAIALGVGSAATLSWDSQEVAYEPDPEAADSCPDCGPGAWPIQMVSSEGGDPHSLTGGDQTGQKAPAWSPDGTRLAVTEFSSAPDAESAAGEIVVMNVDGSGAVPIADGVDPHWSPDGRWIVYGRDHDNDTFPTLFRMLADGSGVEETIGSGDPSSVRFSPDGSSLAWSSRDGHGSFESWILPFDPIEAARTPTGSFARSSARIDLAWAPDGTRIAWTMTSDDGQASIWVGDASGAGGVSVADGSAPSWQPILSGVRQQGG